MLKLSLMEDELELRQVVVEPLRTMFVAVKEVLQELFCPEIGVPGSGQKELVCCWKCIICLIYDESRRQYDVLVTTGDIPYLSSQVEIICSSLLIDI